MDKSNLSYEIIEPKKENKNIDNFLNNLKLEEVSSDIDFTMDNYVALELSYNENFTVKELNKICDYYEICRRKLRKEEIVQEIVLFECDPNNIEIVERRKLLWFYFKEIKSDKFLKKYIIID